METGKKVHFILIMCITVPLVFITLKDLIKKEFFDHNLKFRVFVWAVYGCMWLHYCNIELLYCQNGY